ncbi:MAG: Tat (Twin-arginine translocation) pathway signal sequence containing protein [Flavipsychrobacter sp.]|jgi:hypothetical protein|nr:Tat (Twin-arginine translocation) pathway signal sequence containing protein [Flavipsychrobacter sp.]
MKIQNTPAEQPAEEMENGYDISRRHFFKLTGGIAGIGLFYASCKPPGAPTNIFLGSGDTALLNFIYILQQIEAAFYIQAVATPYYGMDHLELLAITDVRDQEIAHREYLKKLLGNDAVTNISADFSSVTFAERASVLSKAGELEDIVVSGISSAVNLFTNKVYSLALSKMVSVEARHSAYFKDMHTWNSFGDGVDAKGFDKAVPPRTALENMNAFSHTNYDASKLPN